MRPAQTIDPGVLEAFQAYERRERITNTRVGCALVLTLMPAGIPMDYLVYPEHFSLFLQLRLASAALAGLILVLMRLPACRPWNHAFGWIIPFVPVFFITWMIAVSEGFQSPYYAGLNLVLLAVGAVLRWTVRESLFFVLSVLGLYIGTGLLHGGNIPASVLANNFFFIGCMDIIAVVGNYYAHRQRRREFILRHELDASRAQLEESNRKLTELDQIKGRFFANISHELRTPLTLMIAPLEAILTRHRESLSPDTVGLLQTMQSNGLRLLRLINDLLDLVRLDSGVMQVRREPVALEPFLQGLAGAARQVAEDKRIDLRVTVHPEAAGAFPADRDKLEKIILNLQFNALKFTPAGGRVELRADREQDHLLLRVSDTGIGIPARDLPNVFGRFFQVDSSSRRRYQGVGIGLALVKELSELHGGSVSVDSTEGQGTTFTVRLPWLEAGAEPAPAPADSTAPNPTPGTPAPEPGATVSNPEWLAGLYHRANLFGGVARDGLPAPARPAAPGPDDDGSPAPTLAAPVAPAGDRPADTRKETVLVADDQPDMLRFLQSELAPHYQVVAVTDGRQAVDQAAVVRPDLILLDMMMPEMDGIQACRELRAAEATRHVPVILVTAHVDEDTKLKALRAGASDFLPKPFSTTELHVRVRNLVESHGFQRRLARQNRQLEEAIDQLKATESQLVQSEKLASLGRLSAGIIHEINNPLNFVTTGLYTLRRSGGQLPAGQQERFSETLRDVEEGLQRVKTIVSDLRTFTHPDLSDREPVEANEVVEAALRFLSHEWRGQITVETRLTGGAALLGNRNRLVQVLVNLLQNAVDALRSKSFPEGERPLLQVTTSVGDGRCRIVVRDNGPGIDPAHRDKIFDPFFTTKDVGQGMGLGLSICYRIMQDCGGRISVRSEPGAFCEFTLDFELPAPAPAAGPTPLLDA
ncbi:MAG: hypothetical protein RJA22_3012 [Verrucomicrobiota bacterium]|jgi:signal transduction histidine kinase